MSSSSAPSPIPVETISSAVTSLTKWMHARSSSAAPNLLLDDRDDFILLQLSLRRIPPNSRINPHLLPLPHPLFSVQNSVKSSVETSICLIIDDRRPEALSASSFLEKAKEQGLPVGECIGISTLKTDYRPFESRRKLCGSHDLFLAEKRIIPLLPKLIGKTFFAKKKNPIAVNFGRPGWPEQVKKILGSTFLYLRSGTCVGIRVGRLCMKVDEIVENVMKVVEEAVEKVPKKWENVRSLHVKAVDSLALPVYQALPEIGLKIEAGEKERESLEGLEAGEVLDGDDGGDGEKSEEVSEEGEKNSEEIGLKGKKKNKNKKKGSVVRYMDESVGLVGEEMVEDGEGEGEKKKKEKRKKPVKDGEEEKRAKKTKKEESEVVKVKGEKKEKKGKFEGGNVKGDKEKMKKTRSEGATVVEVTDKKGKRNKIRV